jgi:acetyl esterase
MALEDAYRDDVDPEIRIFTTEVNRAYEIHSRGGGSDFPARRCAAEKVRAPWTVGGPAMHSTETFSMQGARVRIYQPSKTQGPGSLVYLHGGGWVMFSIDTHDRLMREYAARSGLTVIGIDYALAPEHPYPVALNQIHSIICELRQVGKNASLNKGRLFLGGDSAGANLALAVALRFRDEGNQIDGLLLNYGAFDTVERSSHERYDGPRYMLTTQEMAGFWSHYLAGRGGEEALSRPLRANMVGLPPTYQCIPQCDILADENLELSNRLRAAGVAVEAHLIAGATHSFLEAVSISKLADQSIQQGAEWLKSHAADAKEENCTTHG